MPLQPTFSSQQSQRSRHAAPAREERTAVEKVCETVELAQEFGIVTEPPRFAEPSWIGIDIFGASHFHQPFMAVGAAVAAGFGAAMRRFTSANVANGIIDEHGAGLDLL